MSGFTELQAKVFGLYGEGRYAEVLELAQKNLPHFVPQEHRLRFWMAGMLSLLERQDEAMATLKEGLSQGQWWNPQQFKGDSDFANLLGIPAFGEILEQCQIAWEMAKVEGQTKLRVYPSFQAMPPLLMALHMRGSNAADSAPHWQTATRQGWMVAVPQSSQVFSMDGFCWDDVALVERELADAQHLLSSQNPFDASSIIYAGASQGGLTAVYLALKNPARGFIAVVPSFGSRISKFDWEPSLTDAAQQGKRGMVITGEKDWALQASQTAVETMQKAGLVVRLEVVTGMGHDYPADMEERLLWALEFVAPNRK